MVKNKEIDSHKVAQMVILRQEGLTQAEIADRLNINQCLVSRHLKKHMETGFYAARKRSGRPRVTSETTTALSTVWQTVIHALHLLQLPQICLRRILLVFLQSKGDCHKTLI